MTLATWRYFQSLEDQFIRTLDYVELSPENAKTYSNEFAKLLVLAGSEVDVVAKQLCAKEHPGRKAAKDINDYRLWITEAFDGQLPTQPVRLLWDLGVHYPWSSWAEAKPKSPIWWKAYNNVKHKRNQCFREATQENVIGAMCGLLTLITYLDQKGDPTKRPATKFFFCESDKFLGILTGRLPGVKETMPDWMVMPEVTQNGVDSRNMVGIETDMIKDGKGHG